MESVFHSEFREDLIFWIANDEKVALRIFKLIQAAIRNPTEGIGKPERLKYFDANTWSRRSLKNIGWSMLLEQEGLILFKPDIITDQCP